MMPASSWSLSCQSSLTTWNGSRDRSPQAVVPVKVTCDFAVSNRPCSIAIASGVYV